MALCGQNPSAFSTAVFQHPASVFGAHALPEAVNILTASVAWLKCALHMLTPVSSRHSESLLHPKGVQARPIIALKAGSPPFSLQGSRIHHGDDSLNYYSCGSENMSRKGEGILHLWITYMIHKVIHGLSTIYPRLIHRIHPL